jgi:prevent-host-death family protein
MAMVNIHEAKTQLSRLLERVLGGEQIVIAKAGVPLARILPIEPSTESRKPGADRGRLVMSDDFDAPLPDEVLLRFER